jgi:hypothetical protein
MGNVALTRSAISLALSRGSTESYDVYVCFFELVDVSLIVGQLPHAVGSPDATIENDNRVFAPQVLRDAEGSAICDLNEVIRKRITWI